MNVSDAGVKLIEQFEGFEDHQYRDSVGVLTIGYGTTRADVDPLPTHVTEEEASDLLREHLDKKYLPYIADLGINLNQNQIDALASFIYNVGPGGIAATTHIGADLRSGRFNRAALDFLDWDKAGGQVLLGLHHRRVAEQYLFCKPVPKPDPLAGYTDDEKRWIREYDSLHGKTDTKSVARRKVLVIYMTRERKLIWKAAQGRGGWNARKRRARYTSLLART